MKKLVLAIPLFILFFAVCACPKVSAFEPLNGKKWLNVGVGERVRYESRVNSAGTTDYMRYLTQTGVTIKPIPAVEFNARLVNENRDYLNVKKPHYADEVVFDLFNVKLNPTKDLSLTFGRQEMIYGAGLVILEGTPGDGSRTIYFNALKGSLKLSPSEQLDVFAIQQPKQDGFLVINNRNAYLNTNKEKPSVNAFGAYLTVKSNPQTEMYYLKTHEFNTPIETRLNTVGGRLSGPITKNLNYSAEVAVQDGKYGRHDKGGYAMDYNLTYKVPVKILTPSINLEYVDLSGDNPATDKDEGWNPLFGQWPKWSELYIYTLNSERGVGYWTNMKQIRAGAVVNPAKNQSLQLAYSYMFANQSFSGKGFANGKVRGQLLQAIYKVNLSKALSAHAWLERFWPGNFYAPGTPNSLFLRGELSAKIK